MKKYFKSLLALSICNAAMLSIANAATYKVEPITELESHEYSYGQIQNGNAQEFIVSGSEQYNFPVIFEYLSAQDYVNIYNLSLQEDAVVFGLNQIDELDAFLQRVVDGETNGNDLGWIVRYLRQQADGNGYQKIGNASAFYDFGAGAQRLTIWDTSFSLQFPSLTQSTEDYLAGINSLGWLYGSGTAPSLPYIYSTTTTNDEGLTVDVDVIRWLSDFDNKAFISLDMGETIQAVEAPLNLYGGISAILDMSEVDGNQVAVGYASIGYNETALTLIEANGSGNDDNENGVIDESELAGCRSSVFNEIEQAECIQNGRQNLYYLNAYKWTFDNNGAVIDEEILGQLITPHVDDERFHASYALSVNSSGVAVGYSTGWWNEEQSNPLVNEPVSDFAVIFKNGEVIDLTPVHSELLNSKATEINDSGVAIGHVTKLVNGAYRTKFFYVDTNNEALDVIFPKDFFTGSSSKANGINENGFIVGEGEVERQSNGGVLNNSNPRRRNGFLYDINTDTFTNLNDFLECNSGYEIIEAQDINELNEITATALRTVPRKDAKGQLVVDENGETLYEDVIQAVKLTPIAGEIVNCDEEEGNLIERKGASFGYWFIGLLSVLGVYRRRYH